MNYTINTQHLYQLILLIILTNNLEISLIIYKIYIHKLYIYNINITNVIIIKYDIL